MRNVINVKEIEKMEAELAEAKGTERYEALRDKYEGPDVGLDYDEDTGKPGLPRAGLRMRTATLSPGMR